MRTVFLVVLFGGIFTSAFPQQSDNLGKTEIAISETYITFTLRNTREESIPIIISGGMSPNLAPNSSSGITLKLGQEILFKYKKKKHVLLAVNEDMKGEVLDIFKLVNEKKKDLDSL